MIAVIGAGAAGLTAAIAAAEAGADVQLFERTRDGGRKILISGGGRCNLLPAALEPERFVTESPRHLLRAMLRSWPLREQQAFFERDLAIPLAFEDDSQKWFPASNRARDVRDRLVSAAARAGVQLRFSTRVEDITPAGKMWAIRSDAGEILVDAVVLATGGLSVPATGSDGAGLALAAALGHRVHATYAALTPLTRAGTPHAGLSGLSTTVRLRARADEVSADANGGFLFTHRGYSGPAALDVSHVVSRRSESAQIRVRWSAHDADAWHRELVAARGVVSSLVGRFVPQRLADQLLFEAQVPAERRAADLRRDERVRLVDHLTAYPLAVTGHEGYKKAEVTGGGVALDEVDPRSLESKRCRGLFFCGEILDAFGPIGGHNFAWAWATGRMAGLSAAAGGR